MFSTFIIYSLILIVLGITGTIILLHFNFTFGLIILISVIILSLIFFLKLGLEREKIIRENNENLKRINKNIENLVNLKIKEMELNIAKIDNPDNK